MTFEELNKYLAAYYERFGDILPTASLRDWTDEQLVELVQECLKDGKNVYERGLLSPPSKVFY